MSDLYGLDDLALQFDRVDEIQSGQFPAQVGERHELVLVRRAAGAVAQLVARRLVGAVEGAEEDALRPRRGQRHVAIGVGTQSHRRARSVAA